MLRALCLPRGACLPVPAGAVLTPLAREYAHEHGLAITELAFESAEGSLKPEHMTHLNASTLVPNQTQALALERGRGETAGALGEVHDLAQRVLAAEVKGEPLGAFTLLGLDSAGLRAASHDPRGFAGLDAHPAPHSGMGQLGLALNFLRTQVREVELAAALAFCLPDGNVERADLLEALNRMSSAVYLLFLKEI
jgi:ethanolamine utilization cobalamin adenosyltransferase